VADTSQIRVDGEPVAAISQRVREREIRRQLRQNRARKAAIGLRASVRAAAAERMPALVREFLETLLGSLLGFLVIFELPARLGGVNPLYTLSTFGLLYASQSTYYKYKLTVEPGFTIPTCRCAGRSRDDTESVLQSRQSAVLGVPNSLFAVAFFAVLLALTALGDRGLGLPLAVIAVAASAYLSYVMLVRIRSLCTICVNIAAINVLILWQLTS
jgi:uncharacterized membrane protein